MHVSESLCHSGFFHNNYQRNFSNNGNFFVNRHIVFSVYFLSWKISGWYFCCCLDALTGKLERTWLIKVLLRQATSVATFTSCWSPKCFRRFLALFEIRSWGRDFSMQEALSFGKWIIRFKSQSAFASVFVTSSSEKNSRTFSLNFV